jgi:hypothetical protein
VLLHARHACNTGFKIVMLRTAGSEVVVTGIVCVRELKLDSLWIAFGVGGNFCYLALHEVVNMLAPEKATALPLFHAMTECYPNPVSGARGLRKINGQNTQL